MADQHWTPLMVEERLAEAADVLKRLPEAKVRGYFNLWPEIKRDFADMVGQKPVPMRRPPPSPAAITRMDETLQWLRWLESEDAKLVWARAEGTPWKVACYRFGKSRAALWRHWVASLQLITIFLNGHSGRKLSRMALARMWQAANGTADGHGASE